MVWIVSILLVLSIAINVVLFWYSKQLVKKFWNISNNHDDFFQLIDEYREHLEIINGMETYYGDEIIENFVKHTKRLVEDLKNYKELYLLQNEDEESEGETSNEK